MVRSLHRAWTLCKAGASSGAMTRKGTSIPPGRLSVCSLLKKSAKGGPAYTDRPPLSEDLFWLRLARGPVTGAASPPVGGLGVQCGLVGLLGGLLPRLSALLGGLVRCLGNLLARLARRLCPLLPGLACGLHGLLARLAGGLHPGLHGLLGGLGALLEVLLADLRGRAQRFLVERQRRV